MFDQVIKEVGQNYSKQDKARMSISHGSLESDIFIHMVNLEHLSGERIMSRFQRVLNSHQELSVDSSFQINVGMLRVQKGGSKSRERGCLPLLAYLRGSAHDPVKTKRSIVEIHCQTGEEICASKAISVLVAKKQEKLPKQQFDNLVRRSRQSTRGKFGLRARGLKLLSQAGLPNDRKLTFNELACFEPIVNAKILIITHGDNGPYIVQCSPSKQYSMNFYLYHIDNHYHACLNEHAMFPNCSICEKCFQIVPNNARNQHPCVTLAHKCFACQRIGCEKQNSISCADCNIVFNNLECYSVHLEKKDTKTKCLCERRKKCLSCNKLVYTKDQSLEEHVCGTYKCGNCNEWVENTHLCYLRRTTMKKTSGKFIFFDFESVSDSIFQCREGYIPKKPDGCGKFIEVGHNSLSECASTNLCSNCKRCNNCNKAHCGRYEHQPVLVVAETVCDSCKNDVLVDDSICKECGDLCNSCNTLNRKYNEKCDIPLCGRRRIVFKGFDTVFEFCKWLFTPAHNDFTVLAHYGKGYDFMFLLNWLVTEANILPSCIFSGSKLMSLHVQDRGMSIKCIDSINFLMMPLKKLPKAFGLKPEQAGMLCNGESLDDLAKLDFPHAFNTRANWDYVGPFPPIQMYDIDSKSKDEQIRLKEWYAKQEGKIFNMQEQLLHYCIIDTTILRLSCMTFRDLLIDITTKESETGELTFVDCFAFLTMASCVMQVYRLNHIEELYEIKHSDGRDGIASFKGGEWFMENEPILSGDIIDKTFISSSIPQLPAQGYVRTSKHSQKSIGWLEYESKQLGRQIRHARNLGEYEVICADGHRYKVDGFDPQPVKNGPKGTIREFLGCYWHGHDCQKQRKLFDQRTKFNMDDLHRQTMVRLERLKAEGYHVKYIYECEFDEMIKNDQNLNTFIQELDIPKRMKIRQAFFGGRTSGFRLHYKVDQTLGEEMGYADVCSLYPYVNKHMPLPYGHPRIITTNFDMSMNSYFGIAHAKVLPPRQLYVGVLPYRCRGKLHFPLCKSCCEDIQQYSCDHTDEQRAITGVWCTPELQEALRSGYKLLKLYEVYQYDTISQYDEKTKSGGLFAEQVNLFLKIKTEASGFPDWVKTSEDEDRYISSFESKTGIMLDKSKIEVNPGLRSLSKLGLNCFWGKLGQRADLTRSVYIKSCQELDKLVSDSTIDLTNFHIINENVMVVEYRKEEQFIHDSGFTNEVIAAFTTCHARLELLRHIRSVGETNIMYCDTDSILFKTRKTLTENGNIVYENYPQLGDCLGELTNELPANTYIEEFCCSAPKSYGFRRNDGVETTKFKGVTLNFTNSKRINFESVKELVFGRKKRIILDPQTQFVRCKFNGVITNVPLVKRITHTFDKRRILKNLNTVPFGYVDG